MREIHALTKRPLPLTTKHQPPACAEATAGRLATLSDPASLCKMSKNRRASAAHDALYHVFMGMQIKITSLDAAKA